MSVVQKPTAAAVEECGDLTLAFILCFSSCTACMTAASNASIDGTCCMQAWATWQGKMPVSRLLLQMHNKHLHCFLFRARNDLMQTQFMPLSSPCTEKGSMSDLFRHNHRS